MACVLAVHWSRQGSGCGSACPGGAGWAGSEAGDTQGRLHVAPEGLSPGVGAPAHSVAPVSKGRGLGLIPASPLNS